MLDAIARPLDICAAVMVDGVTPWDPGCVISHEANRWSRDREPTAYLASDPGVALAEAGRHLELGDRVRVASIWQVRLTVDRAVDVREPDVARALGVPTHPIWILDRARCRSVANTVRALGVAAMQVPSAAFLDAPARFDVVLFPEVVPGPMSEALLEPCLLAVLEPRRAMGR